jgi:hypothetical protein
VIFVDVDEAMAGRSPNVVGAQSRNSRARRGNGTLRGVCRYALALGADARESSELRARGAEDEGKNRVVGANGAVSSRCARHVPGSSAAGRAV